MILSHRHKFVFVKPGKTAGSSVELTLTAICGEDDLITSLRTRDELLRPETNASVGKPKYKNIQTGEIIEINNHMPYRNVLQVFGEKIAGYSVICSERNPWEKAISSFYWKGNRRPERPELPRFKKFVKDGRPPNDFDVYSLYGVSIADRILRVESLADDIHQLAESLGESIQKDQIVRASKAYMRPKHATREAMYEKPWLRNLVAEQSIKLLSVLPYSFDTKESPDYEISPDRYRVRNHFLETNDCGPEFWQKISD